MDTIDMLGKTHNSLKAKEHELNFKLKEVRKRIRTCENMIKYLEQENPEEQEIKNGKTKKA